MAPKLERFTITSPETSQSFRDTLRVSIDDGSSKMELILSDTHTHQAVKAEFRLRQTRYRDMSTEYIGELVGHGIASIIVMTHPDLSDAPARLTLARRHTP